MRVPESRHPVTGRVVAYGLRRNAPRPPVVAVPSRPGCFRRTFFTELRMNSPTAGEPASHAPRAGQAHTPFDPDQFFGRQRTPTRQLPPPEPLLENLTRCVMEVLAGARELDQLARWISE